MLIKKMKWLLNVSLGLLVSHYTFAAQFLSFEGRATDLKTDKLLYIEKHHVMLNDSGEYLSADVEYIDPNGEVFAEKKLDFSKSNFAPDMVFYDGRSQESITVFLDIKTSFISVLKEKSGKREETMLKSEDSKIVIDAGFDRFIQSNWIKLSENRQVDFDFLALTRSKFFSFEVFGLDADANFLNLQLQPSNFLIGMLVDPITLSYDQNTKRLMLFEGLTNIERFENGKRTEENYVARIEYHYQPLRTFEMTSQERSLKRADSPINKFQSGMK